ncbi:MCE family protein [Nocardia sp. NBC_00565]|uniref:MlaD family protein n=1 Tax=Nocardia sp. NBC_00565 TaxID=2975993 RepID=UPI002E81A1F4|nr:MlaD family protein [Nocardia sp. NBC_00565]WUC05564.1 MCE family protein [Nocardia sp. NBC_00565]
MEQDFLRGTARRQTLTVEITAAVVVLIVVIAVALGMAVHRQQTHSGKILLGIEIPYVAPGVAVGTHVMMHGVEVGEVTELRRIDQNALRMTVALNPDRAVGLTDTFEFDYRPENYFGVTAVNLQAGAAGAKLVSGRVLARTPLGDYSMSTMIEKGSLVVDGTLTNDVIDTLDKVVRYTNGLNPMIQTGIIVTDRIAKTQQALPSESIGYFNNILAVLPAFDREFVASLNGLFYTSYNRRADGSLGVNNELMDRDDVGLQLAAGKLFGAAGHLLASHATELPPIADVVQAMTDVIPDVLAHGSLTDRFRTLVEQYDRAITGPEGAKTLNLRIALDRLPMLAAPFGLPASGQEPPR